MIKCFSVTLKLSYANIHRLFEKMTEEDNKGTRQKIKGIQCTGLWISRIDR